MKLGIAITIAIILLCQGRYTSAQESLSQCEEEIAVLIERLGQEEQQQVVDALAKIGDPAVEPLFHAVKDRSVKTWAVRVGAINALAKIGTQSASKVLIELLKDKELSDLIRGMAASAAAETKFPDVVTPFIEALSDDSKYVRLKCAKALGKLGLEQSTDALILVLADEDEEVRAAAATALGAIKSENAIDDLVNALGDSHWQVQLSVRNALSEVGRLAVNQLIAALKHENNNVRWQAALVLGRIKSENAVEPLIEALADPDWMVREQASVALVQINSSKTGSSLTKALNYKAEYARKEADWVLEKMRSSSPVAESRNRHTYSKQARVSQISYNGRSYPCFPKTLDGRPDIPSPYTTDDGIEVVTILTRNKEYMIVPVTVENGEPLNYGKRQWGKGLQLVVDAKDFPTLALTGLHSEIELDRTRTITGRSVVEITALGRPERSSSAGFMGYDEDIISVIKQDNQLVRKLALTHQDLAKPLFHVWNIMLNEIEQKLRDNTEHILYNAKKVEIITGGLAESWQESLFDDEILGAYQFVMWRELNNDEKALLNEKYSRLSKEQMAELVKKLTYIHTGEMAPYYIMRYRFYEGHTNYRADPIAIAWIFGLKSLEQIEHAFEGKLFEVLTRHFTRDPA